MTGPLSEEVKDMPDLRPRELWAVAPLVALIIVLGVYPKPVIDLINPAVHATLSQAHSTNPVPPHPAKVADEVSGRRTGGAFCGLPSAERTCCVCQPGHFLIAAKDGSQP